MGRTITKYELNNRGVGGEGVVRVQVVAQKDNVRSWFSHRPSQHKHEDIKKGEVIRKVSTDFLTFLERREIRLCLSQSYQCGAVQESGHRQYHAQRHVPGRQIVLA